MAGTEQSANFTLQGTVTAIIPKRGNHPHHRWLVTIDVDKVIHGYFSEKTFSFFIHSPVKSGVVNHGMYLIQATQNDTGDIVIEKISPWKA